MKAFFSILSLVSFADEINALKRYCEESLGITSFAGLKHLVVFFFITSLLCTAIRWVKHFGQDRMRFNPRLLKLWQNKKVQYLVSFLQLAVEKKTPFLVHPKQIFGPSYFVGRLMAIDCTFLFLMIWLKPPHTKPSLTRALYLKKDYIVCADLKRLRYCEKLPNFKKKFVEQNIAGNVPFYQTWHCISTALYIEEG